MELHFSRLFRQQEANIFLWISLKIVKIIIKLIIIVNSSFFQTFYLVIIKFIKSSSNLLINVFELIILQCLITSERCYFIKDNIFLY
jgi:hypothetical protein